MSVIENKLSRIQKCPFCGAKGIGVLRVVRFVALEAPSERRSMNVLNSGIRQHAKKRMANSCSFRVSNVDHLVRYLATLWIRMYILVVRSVTLDDPFRHHDSSKYFVNYHKVCINHP